MGQADPSASGGSKGNQEAGGGGDLTRDSPLGGASEGTKRGKKKVGMSKGGVTRANSSAARSAGR